MLYRPDTGPGPERGDELLEDALFEWIATGGWEHSPALESAIRAESGRIRGTRPSVREWNPVANLRAMSWTLRALELESVAVVALTDFYRDQREHGQPTVFRVGHRGKVEDESVLYARYQAEPALAVFGCSAFPRELREEAARWLRREVTLYALHLTPAGRLGIAHGRTMPAAAGRGGATEALEQFVCSVIGRPDPPLDRISRRDLKTRREFRLAQIAAVEGPELGAALFRPDELAAFGAWIERREVEAPLRRLVSEIRLFDGLRLVAWDGGHVSWWPRMRTYLRGKPFVSMVLERYRDAHVEAGLSRVERIGRAVWRVIVGDRSNDRTATPVGRVREWEFRLEGPPMLDGVPVDVEPSRPPALWEPKFAGFVGDQGPEEPEFLPRDVTTEMIEGLPHETRTFVESALAARANRSWARLDRAAKRWLRAVLE